MRKTKRVQQNNRNNGVMFTKWCCFRRPFLRISHFVIVLYSKNGIQVLRVQSAAIHISHNQLYWLNFNTQYKANFKCKFCLLLFLLPYSCFSSDAFDLVFFYTFKVNLLPREEYEVWCWHFYDWEMDNGLKIHAKENKCHLIE